MCCRLTVGTAVPGSSVHWRVVSAPVLSATRRCSSLCHPLFVRLVSGWFGNRFVAVGSVYCARPGRVLLTSERKSGRAGILSSDDWAASLSRQFQRAPATSVIKKNRLAINPVWPVGITVPGPSPVGVDSGANSRPAEFPPDQPVSKTTIRHWMRKRSICQTYKKEIKKDERNARIEPPQNPEEFH